MATLEELHQQIALAQRAVEDEKVLGNQLEASIELAEERQRLRRDLERVQNDVDLRKYYNEKKRVRQRHIDQDICGRHLPDNNEPAFFKTGSAVTDAKDGEVYNCSNAVVKGEYIWRIEGLSWLPNTLKQECKCYADIDDCFRVGTDEFDLRYNPHGDLITHGYERHSQTGTIGIIHLSEGGITFRYKVSIKQRDGDFVQWGETGNECHAGDSSTYGVAFGPDIRSVRKESHEVVMPTGIFGLTHAELLQSEWVVDDALTVKFQLEVRQDEGIERWSLDEPRVNIPPETLRIDLLSLFESGKGCDITFIVQGHTFKAHSQILLARSEVFEKHFSSGMRESVSKEIAVEDCDAAAFKGLLRFLYTDDFSGVENMVKEAHTECDGSSDSSGSKMGLLQNILAVSHKYQVSRLMRWCEEQLCRHIGVPEVCSVLCQAHLYEAKQLEKACLTFIKKNMQLVMLTPMFSSLAKDWPAVMLKISIFIAGIPEESAAAALQRHEQCQATSSSPSSPAVLQGKRKRQDS